MSERQPKKQSTEDMVKKITADILHKYVYTEESANRICEVFYDIHRRSLGTSFNEPGS